MSHQLKSELNSTFPISTELANFDSLPESAYVRLPTVKALFACSTSSVWRGIKAGRIPAPVKLSPRTSCFSVKALRLALKRNGG